MQDNFNLLGNRANKSEAEAPDTKKAIIQVTPKEAKPEITDIIKYTKSVNKPPEDYGIVVLDISLGLFGRSILTEKELSALRSEARKKGVNKYDNKDILIQRDESTGVVRNNLTVFDKKFIIALQILLSDQTERRHEIIEAHRKPKKKKELTLEIPDIFTGVDKNGLPPVLAEDMKKDGFNDKDIIVIIPGKAFFLKNYLGYKTVGGKEYDNFDKALSKLRTGLLAIIGDIRGTSAQYSKLQSLIKNVTIYNYKEAGGTDLNIYVIALLPILTEGIGNNYKLIPKNNAEIFNAIGDNEALFSLYDWILYKLSRNDPGEKITQRGELMQVTATEEDLLTLISKDKNELSKHRKRWIDTLYKGFKMFYELGLLAYEVQQPTEEERKSKGKKIELTIYLKRIATGNM